MATDLVRGLPLVDRLPAPPHDPAAGERGWRRLDRWRRQEPFGDSDCWQARLEADGLDEQSLLQLLGEDPQDLAGRTKPLAWGQWVGTPMPVDDGEPDLEEDPYLARAAGNLIAQVRDELAADLTDTGLSHLLDQLTDPLRRQIHGMLARTFALEVNLARLNAGRDERSGAERFLDELARLATPQRQQEFLTAYPVLARQLDLAARQWLSSCSKLVKRLHRDRAAIVERFGGEASPGEITSIALGTGDRHRGGQSVAIIGWAGGLKVVYKPRPLSVDVHFGQLIEWVNARGFSHPLYSPACLDRGSYGWAEFITAVACSSPDQIRRFYHRQGGLLALLELLRANDMHAENLIAAGEHPVLVDLETLWQPGLPLRDAGPTGAELKAAEAARASVLQVGLLPTLTWVNQDGEGVDVSGLGNRPGQRSSVSLPALSEVGSDTMRVRMERVDLDVPDHRPVGAEDELCLLDYADDIIAGYAQMHRLCRESADALLAPDGPLEAFRGDRVRIVVRSTMVYAMLLSTGFHPDVLRDGLERDRHFDYLWRRQTLTPQLQAVIAAERRDLWRNDVPYFSTITGSESLLDSDDQPVPDFPLTCALTHAKQSLLAWDEGHLSAQLMLIRNSLSAAAINSAEEFSYPEYELPEPTAVATGTQLIEAALDLGEELRRQAFTDAHSAQWLGLSSRAGRNWSAGPLGADLFNGIAGVAVFLAELGRASGERVYRDLAAKAVTTMRSQLRQELAVPGGMAGVPGMAWALCRLAVLLDDESLLAEAQAVAARLLPLAAKDRQFDIVGGGAGTIVALGALHRLTPEGPAIELIEAAARRLRETARPFGPGTGWVPAAIAETGTVDVPLAGLGHGNAGIAWALAKASDLLDDTGYADLAREAIAYEQTLFRPDLGSWLDAREPHDTRMIRAWCHGSAGIGMARIAGLREVSGPDIDEQITAALSDTRRNGFGLSHVPCHGDTGATELLLVAADGLRQPHLRAEAARWAGSVLDSARAAGWICGVPYGASTPSMMVGLAGIGYGLLRVAEPYDVPSVLLLDDGWVS